MNYLKSLIITLLGIFTTTTLFSFFSYNNIISEKILLIIQFLILFIIIILESYNLGKKKEKKGYIEGLIYGILISFVFLIINIIFKRKIDIYKLFYYLIIIIISIFSSIIGINKKTKD